MAATTFLGNAVATPASLAVKDLTAAPAKQVSVRAFVVRASAAEQMNSIRTAGVAALAAATLLMALPAPPAHAGLVEDLLAQSASNKALNDKKRLITSSANVARAYTVQFGICQFPDNFTGCEDLADTKKGVKFLSEDHAIECEGKEPGKCAAKSFGFKK